MATTTVLRQWQPSVQESLSPQQLREWAIWWGSPGGGASRARVGGVGAGGPRTRRREPLSSQQLRKRAVRWGSLGGGAWGATIGGPCESTPAGSAAGRRGGSGGGQQRQQRPPETLSPQQLREWAVRWGSPSGGAWGTSAGGGEAPGGVEAASLGAVDSASTVLRVHGDLEIHPKLPILTAEPEEALHTFTLDSGVSRCFFRDSTTVTPLTVLVPVTLADPSGGPVVARGAIVLPCSAAPLGLLTGLHLPSFAKNLVATSVLQDQWVTNTEPGGELVGICTDSRTGEHLVTFTRRLGSSLYTLTTESALVAKSGQVAASVEVASSCSCRLLTHQTLLWHHRLSHPSLLHLRGMHSRLLVSGLLRSQPPLPRSLAPPCLPCVQGQQPAAPHSSSFPPTTTPLQTLHMDVDVSGVLIHWIRAVRLQLRARFQQDLPVLRLHSDRGGEFCSHLLEDLCVQSYTLPASPQQNGIAEHRIGLVIEGSLSLVRNLPAGKLSPRTLRCVFLGFPADAPPWQFYHLGSRRVLSSYNVTFDESVCFYHLHPHRSFPVPLQPLSLVDDPPLVAPLPPPGPAPSSVSQVDPPPLVEPLEVSSDTSGPAEGGDLTPSATVTPRRSARLAVPSGFKPRLSSPPLQPIAVDSGAAGCGTTGGAGSGGAECPLGTGGTGGTGAGGPATRRQETLSPEQLREWAVQWGSPGGGASRACSPRAGGTRGAAAVGTAPGSPGGGAGRAGAAVTGGTGAAGGAGGAGSRGASPGGAGAGVPGTGGTGAAGGVGGSRGASLGGASAGVLGTGGIGAAGVAGGSRGASPGGASAGVPGTGGTRAAGGAGGAGTAGGAGGATGGTAGGTGVSAGGTGSGVAVATGAGGSGGATTQPQPSALRRLLSLPPVATEFPVPGTTPPLLFPPTDQSQPQLLPGSPLPALAPHTEVTASLTARHEPETRASTPEHREPETRAFVLARVRRVRRPRAPAWLTRDAAARLAIRNHLPLAECAHFRQHRTAQALYDAVVARYSSHAIAALGRLLLPYLFPELSPFAIVEDLVSHLRTSDARYRAALPAEFLAKNLPLMYITLYFIVTRLPDSLRAVRDHFLALDPTALTVDLLEQHLLAAETSVVVVGAACGTPRTPFFEGCSPSPLAPSYASATAVDVLGAEDVGAASASGKRRSSKGKGGRSGGGGSGGGGGGSSGGGGGSGGGGRSGSGGESGGFGGGGGGSGGSGGSGSGGSGGGRTGAQRGGSGGGQRQRQQRRSETPSPQQLRDRAGQTCGKPHNQHRCFSRLDNAWRTEFGDEVERPHWEELLRSGVAIFDLDYDAILSAMYALSASAEGDCYRCVPPDPDLEAAALGASLPGIAPAEALHTFTLDSGPSRYFFRDSTTLTPLPALVPVRLADPSGGPVVARSSTVLPCPARVSICTCTQMGRYLAMLHGSLLHSLDFSTAFLQGSLHEEIWLHHPPSFTGSFPAGTQWSLRRPVYGLRQAPCEWHDKLRATLAAIGFAPSTADPSLFLRTDTSLALFYVLVYVHNLVFAIADTEALALALQRFGFQFSSPQPTPLSTSHSLSAPPSDESVEPSGPYPELVGCLMYPMTCTRPDLAYPLSLVARYVAPGRHRKVHWDASKRVLRYLCSTSGMGLVLGGWGLVVLTGHAHASLVDDSAMQRSSQGYTFSLGSDNVSWRSTHLSSVLSSSCEAEIYAGAMQCGQLRLVYVATRANTADIFTKALPPGDHQRFSTMLGLRVVLPSPPASSLPHVLEPESDLVHATSRTVTRLLATVVTDPSFESAAASALVTELVHFVALCRLDYAASLVLDSSCPLSVRGELALGHDVLVDRQFELECLVAAAPHLASTLLCPEGDLDALDIPTRCTYAEAITGPYSSQWQIAMDAKMASRKSTSTYVDEVPSRGANIVDGMWIFRVKGPPGSPPAFKARYVARVFRQREGVDFFQTFSPTSKMTTLRVLLLVAAQRDYELHSLDFSIAFLQGSLHEAIWLRRPRSFTRSFLEGTQWSLWRPVYGLRQAPREWHDTMRTTLAALGFAPSTADPLPFLRTNTSLPPFYVLVYIDDLVFAIADTGALALVKAELQERHICTDLEPSGPYPELVGCLMYLMTTSGMGLVLGGPGPVVLTGHSNASWADDRMTHQSTQGYSFSLGTGSVSWRSNRSSCVLSSSCEAEIYAGAMAAQELRWLTYLLTDLGEQPRSPPILTKHIALRYFLTPEVQQSGQLRLAYVATQANSADVFTKALGSSDHQRFCTSLGLVPTLPHLLVS
ncbi:unnamed protein product [Closterium sp. NIES-53]